MSTSVLGWQSRGTLEVASVCLLGMQRSRCDLYHNLCIWVPLAGGVDWAGNVTILFRLSRCGVVRGRTTQLVSPSVHVLRAARWSGHCVGVSADFPAGPGRGPWSWSAVARGAGDGGLWEGTGSIRNVARMPGMKGAGRQGGHGPRTSCIIRVSIAGSRD
eukprot:6077035-Pyramimonas_sp.AAC.1